MVGLILILATALAVVTRVRYRVRPPHEPRALMLVQDPKMDECIEDFWTRFAQLSRRGAE